MMNTLNNQTITGWAKEELKYAVFADHKSRLPLYGFSVLLLLLPMPLVYGGVSNFLSGRPSESVVSLLIVGISGIVLFGGVIAYFVMYYWRNLLESLDQEGVEISSGRRLLWSNFQYINQIHSTGQGGRQFLRRYELVFSDGRALIPADLKNIEKIEVLLYLMPVEHRVNGKLPAN